MLLTEDFAQNYENRGPYLDTWGLNIKGAHTWTYLGNCTQGLGKVFCFYKTGWVELINCYLKVWFDKKDLLLTIEAVRKSFRNIIFA